MNPFNTYIPKQIGSNQNLYVKKEFIPSLELKATNNGTEISALINGRKKRLYTIEDMFQYNHTINAGTIMNIKGLIGERMLSLVMEYFLETISKNTPDYKEFGVLRETERHKGKGFISMFNDKYLLRFKGRSHFVILKKEETLNSNFAYNQEKMGLLSTEIDGLGYFHTNSKRYLIVGESSTKNKFLLNAYHNEHEQGNIFERVFNPLKSLLPDHEIIYFVMSPRKTLFEDSEKKTKLKSEPAKVFKKLSANGIESIFSPLPRTSPSVDIIANQLGEKIGFVNAVMEYIKKENLSS